MNNQELINEIDKWDGVFLSNTTIDPSLYELAFFKVFIKFEKFLSDCFENYAIGSSSSSGYSPIRRLNFDDLSHLNKVIKKENRSFVNHFEVIKNISDCFFIDNPFDIIKTDPTYTTIINQMKIIRDYIAHESLAARNKYVMNILNNRPFIEPHQHLLQTKRGTANSFYSYYIDSIKTISNFIINTPITT
ncbi:hypothetical protein AAIP55_002080 [Flavobacterium psychrophilum]|uniref:hypothetical protein n=1 Tax=Flavobacterium psychrophilum TaxID=96345 RepID=UPI002A46019E|nr:hypothetical protein [Flavobacterium psychrophilum]EKT4518115.1 hypothetical protein [Flavobacterium psychrophilum]